MFQNVKYRTELNVFLVNVLREMKKCVILHPLSGAKLPVSIMKEFIERFT